MVFDSGNMIFDVQYPRDQVRIPDLGRAIAAARRAVRSDKVLPTDLP